MLPLQIQDSYDILTREEGEMVKKKVNPNKIPLSDGKLDVNKITEAATDKSTLIAWAEILGALADFSEMRT